MIHVGNTPWKVHLVDIAVDHPSSLQRINQAAKWTASRKSRNLSQFAECFRQQPYRACSCIIVSEHPKWQVKAKCTAEMGEECRRFCNALPKIYKLRVCVGNLRVHMESSRGVLA